jgi:hypothetical protein
MDNWLDTREAMSNRIATLEVDYALALTELKRIEAERDALRAENARLRHQLQGRTFVAEQPGPLERLEAWARENPHIEPGIGRNYGTKGQPVGWYVSIPGCCIGIERTLAAAIEAALKQVEARP